MQEQACRVAACHAIESEESTKCYLFAGSEGVGLAEGVEDEIYVILHLYMHS